MSDERERQTSEVTKPQTKPAKYYPFMSGKFEVAAGLRPFGTDFSNGNLDQKVIQIDEDYFHYLENKNQCRNENIHKYCCFHEFDKTLKPVCDLLISKILSEYPEYFELEDGKECTTKCSVLHCKLSNEKLIYNNKAELLDCSRTRAKYINLFDALCAQIQEDVAVIQLNKETNENYMSAIHLCSAGHWAASDKIGKDFFAIHVPVPHIEQLNARAKQFVDTMIFKGPWVRFVWGFATDLRLNHHPVPPEGVSLQEWHGRSFQDANKDKLYVRVERQVTWGLPEINASVFFIRVSYLNGEDIKNDPEKRQKLLESLLSMSPQSRDYKGVTQSFDALVRFLS